MTQPPFFSKDDFNELAKFAGQAKEPQNEDQQRTYDILKSTYLKIEYWAKATQEKLYPEGRIHVLKKPTNQANKFSGYQWAKIYPDERLASLGSIAFTVGIDVQQGLVWKIDTVGLGEANSKRQQFLKMRSEQASSGIESMSTTLGLDLGWTQLLALTSETFINLRPQLETYATKLFSEKTLYTVNELSSSSQPLNQILYGPPGTGKTYATIEKAVTIANRDFINRGKGLEKEIWRKILKEEYSRLVQAGQISFTSFHQSLSYEDFIEGIKPLEPEAGEALKYDLVDGIFKIINKRAQSAYELKKNPNKGTLSFEDAFQQFKDEWDNDQQMKFPLKTKGYEFTILSFSNTSIRFRKSNGGTGHTLSINTLRDQYYGKQYDFKQGVGIYYPAILNKLHSYKLEKNLFDSSKDEIKNFVLIIDEINRGNVSQIFGELITLLEEDKRMGNTEALSLTLPYSKDTTFSVPPNLYIIGTLNTADRSIESLDTALRRRFSFEFLPPDPTLVAEDVEGVPLRALFELVNERISYLLDRDHQIGHAYFIKIKELEELKEVFRNKIIPLLEEYFFNDYKQIYLILGEAFVRKVKDPPKFAVKFLDEYVKDLYALNPINETFDIKSSLLAAFGK